MNPLVVKLLPWGIIVLLLLALAGMTDLYLGERDELAKLESSVETLGEAAKGKVEAERQRGLDNLKILEKSHEKDLEKAASTAIANYRLRHPAARSCPLPGNGASSPLDDGAQQEPLLDGATIAECGRDAEKVAAWQKYCELNHCPVED